MDRREFIKTVALGAAATLLPVGMGKADHSVPVALSNGNYRAAVLRADVPNGNGRVYPRAVLDKFVREFRPPMSGHIGMGTDSSVIDVSHAVRQLSIQDDYLFAEIEVIPTSKGKELHKWLQESPEMISFRTASFGTCKREGNNQTFWTVIGEDVTLQSINAISVEEAAKLC